MVGARVFVGTNPENAANFCIARRSGGISAIVSGRLPRSRLLARNNFRIDRDPTGTGADDAPIAVNSEVGISDSTA
jgi:hypothetical protein